jgi:hypothetical protein
LWGLGDPATISADADIVSRPHEVDMLILLIVLLVLWLIAAVIGFAFKGLIWLAIIAIVLFAGTVAIGFVRRNSLRR